MSLRLRLSAEAEQPAKPFDDGFERAWTTRVREADEFYEWRLPEGLSAEERAIARQGYAGLGWSKQFFHFYGDDLRLECPTGSGKYMTLGEVAREVAARLTRIFLRDASGRRPVHGGDLRYSNDPVWKDLALFYEYFHGDNGRGLGASHQTGWTALAVSLLEDLASNRVPVP